MTYHKFKTTLWEICCFRRALDPRCMLPWTSPGRRGGGSWRTRRISGAAINRAHPARTDTFPSGTEPRLSLVQTQPILVTDPAGGNNGNHWTSVWSYSGSRSLYSLTLDFYFASNLKIFFRHLYKLNPAAAFFPRINDKIPSIYLWR